MKSSNVLSVRNSIILASKDLVKSGINISKYDTCKFNIYRITEGRGIILVNGNKRIVSVDNVFIQMESEKKQFQIEQGNLTVDYITFDGLILSVLFPCCSGINAMNILQRIVTSGEVLTKKNVGHSIILNALESIISSTLFIDDEIMKQMMVISDLWKLIACLYEYEKQIMTNQEILNYTKNNDRLAIVIDYININYNQRITIEQLSKIACMSTSNLIPVFKKATGITPFEYITKVRVENAARLLGTTDLKIIDIAEECGYFSISNFIKSFKSIMNILPSEFRKKNYKVCSGAIPFH